MSIKIMSEVWENADSSGGELLFLLALADVADDEDRCAWPGVKTLMQKTRSSRRSIYNYAERAQEQGIITALDGDDRPRRYGKQPGRETTCWRINPVSEWRGAEDAPVQQDAPQGCTQPDPRGATGCTRTTTTHQETEGNFSGAPRHRPKGSLRRFKKGALPESEETVGRLPDDPLPAPAADDSPVDINEYRGKEKKPRKKTRIELAVEAFADEALACDSVALAQRDTQKGALGTSYRKWMEQGIRLTEIEEAQRLFFLDPRGYVAGDEPLWKAFINRFSALHTRATSAIEREQRAAVDHTDYEKEQETWIKASEFSL